MNEIAYVNEASIQMAREWEGRFQKLHRGAGVIFVSVEPTPTLGGVCTRFDVILGIHSRFDVGTGSALIAKVLAEESKRFTIRSFVNRGVSGACYDQNPETAHRST